MAQLFEFTTFSNLVGCIREDGAHGILQYPNLKLDVVCTMATDHPRYPMYKAMVKESPVMYHFLVGLHEKLRAGETIGPDSAEAAWLRDFMEIIAAQME